MKGSKAYSEVLEDRLRHVIPKLEHAMALGGKQWVRLTYTELIALQIVAKDSVASLTIQRSTDAGAI